MRIKKYVYITMFVTLLVACSKVPPSEDVETSDLDVSITYYDPDVDWSTYTTFQIADTFGYVTQNGLVADYDDNSNVEAIKSVIRNQMTSRGYTETTSNPDIGISGVVIVNTQVDAVTYPGWWWGYGGVWGDPWYWGYPGYDYYYPWYGATYYYSSTYGTLSVEMVDLLNQDAANTQINVMWNGIVHGIDSGSSTNDLNRVVQNLNQCFEQSTFMKK